MSDLRTTSVRVPVLPRGSSVSSVPAPNVSFSSTGSVGSSGSLKTVAGAELLLRLHDIDFAQRYELAALVRDAIIESQIKEPVEIEGIFTFLADENISLREIYGAYGNTVELRVDARGFLTEIIVDDHLSGEIVSALLPEEPSPGNLVLDTKGLQDLLNLSPAVSSFLEIKEGQTSLTQGELLSRLRYLETSLNTKNYKVPESAKALEIEYSAYNAYSIHRITTGESSVALGVLEYNLVNTADPGVNSFEFRQKAATLLGASSKMSTLENAKTITFLKQLTELSALKVHGVPRLLTKVTKKIAEGPNSSDGLYLETSMILQMARDLNNSYGKDVEIEVSYTPRPSFEIDFRVVKPGKSGRKETYFGECKTSIEGTAEKSTQRRKLIEFAEERNGFVAYIIQGLNKDLNSALNNLRSARPDPFSLSINKLRDVASNPKVVFWNDSGEDTTDKVKECLGYLDRVHQG